MKLKKAFTLAEAILTMTILGIIAAVMITTLKPSQYKGQGYLALKQRIYTELDDVSQTILVECCNKMSFASVYGQSTSCARTQAYYTFDANVVNKYSNYMRGTVNSASCPKVTITADFNQAASIKLKNGACVWFRAVPSGESGYNAENNIGKILIDVNGKEGPNAVGSGNDRVILDVGVDGIYSDMPIN